MGAQAAAAMNKKQSRQTSVRVDAVVLFAELRNFTRMSEMLEPDRVLALVDQFFECAASAVKAHGGETLEVHNDSLMSAFRQGKAPEQARAAVRAAQQLFGDFDAVAQAWERDYGLRTAVALGVHHGPVVVGEAGPAVRRVQAVLGDCVSIAERLVHRARAGELVMSLSLIHI